MYMQRRSMKKTATAIKDYTVCKSVIEGLLHVARAANTHNTPLNRLIYSIYTNVWLTQANGWIYVVHRPIAALQSRTQKHSSLHKLSPQCGGGGITHSIGCPRGPISPISSFLYHTLS
jgi:hypothetical protein